MLGPHLRACKSQHSFCGRFLHNYAGGSEGREALFASLIYRYKVEREMPSVEQISSME